MAYFAPCIDASGIHMPTYEGRLFLLQGEWRENPGIGFPVPEYLQEGRVTEADTSVLSSRITAYIRETPGVRNVEEVRFEVSGRELLYDCTVRTEEGTAAVRYEAGL